MSFSHEMPQRELGRRVETEFIKLLALQGASEAEKAFMRNLLTSMTKTLRNMGFVRDNHVRYLDDLGRQLKDKQDDWNSLGDFTSLSKAGFPAKIISVLGVGSLIGTLGAGIQLVLNISTSVLSGVVGALLVTLFFRHFRDKAIDKARDTIEKKANNFWVTDFKPDMSKLLYRLFLDIKTLVGDHYSVYAQQQPKATDDMLGWSVSDVKNFINVNVLPPDSISWPPYPFEGEPGGHITTPTPTRPTPKTP